jgi:phosphoserine phosphatase RsbU/P
VAKPASPRKHLKLYTEQPPKKVAPPIQAVASLPELLRTFQAATGWTLRYVPGSEKDLSVGPTWSAPVAGGPAFGPGALVLEPPAEKAKTTGQAGSGQSAVGSGHLKSQISNPASEIPGPPSLAPRPGAIGRDNARKLAGSIAELLGELLQTRTALWRLEAELAAGVPLVPHRENEKHLAARLEAVLRAGAEAIGGDAIALYLLDEATTELKLRCSWGLPFDRLVAPARPLQGAVADLEALLGHAVVLNDERVMKMWNMPEDFPAAVCVPVSTPTTLLGTLWVFSNEKRDFNDRETNILEVVAGRLASDLEREMLLRVGTDGADLQKQMAVAERLQRNELPTISPLLDGWNVAGWTAQAGGVGGAFHDWFGLPRGLLAVAAGKAAEPGIAGALTANAVKTAVRAHARYHRQAERVLQQVNLTLWTGSAGDQRAALFCGLIETATGRVCCASAGQLSVLRLHSDGWQSLSQSSLSLGESPEADFQQYGHELQPGEVLVVLSDSIRDAVDSENRPFGEAGLAGALQGKLHLSAEELVAAAREALSAHAVTPDSHDRTILVVKRTPA